MNKFVKDLGVFLGFSSVIYIIGVCFLGGLFPKFVINNLQYNKGGITGHLFTRLKEADTTRNVDVMVLGSSHAYRSFDPRKFEAHGLKMFNLGSSAQTFMQTIVLANRYIDTMNPKLVIVEVNPALFASDGVESALDLITNGKIDSDVLNMAFTVNHIKVYNTLLYATFRQLLNQNEHFIEPFSTDDGDVYISGGYVGNSKKIEHPLNHIPTRIEVKERQIEAFINLIAFLKRRGVSYILVQTPITKSRFDTYINVEEFDLLFEKHGNYINFNENLSFPDSLFYDYHHLNVNGADRFNDALINYLETDSLLPKI